MIKIDRFMMRSKSMIKIILMMRSNLHSNQNQKMNILVSQDLTRLHQKLQRRIHRRASLTRANASYGGGEVDRRRASIMEKCMD